MSHSCCRVVNVRYKTHGIVRVGTPRYERISLTVSSAHHTQPFYTTILLVRLILYLSVCLNLAKKTIKWKYTKLVLNGLFLKFIETCTDRSQCKKNIYTQHVLWSPDEYLKNGSQKIEKKKYKQYTRICYSLLSLYLLQPFSILKLVCKNKLYWRAICSLQGDDKYLRKPMFWVLIEQ